MSLQFNATRIEVAGEKRRVEGLGLIFGVGFYSSLKSPDFRYVQNRNPHFSSGSREAGLEK